MNMPRFTGEASLYKTSGHYRTGRNRGAIHLPGRMSSPITPAAIASEVPINVPGEEIEVHGEAPPCPLGWINIGGTCVLEAPSSGGGPGTVGEPYDKPVGGGTPPTKDKPKVDKPKVDKPPRILRKSPENGEPFEPKDGKPCHGIEYKWGGGVLVTDPAIVTQGDYGVLSSGDVVCRQPPGDPRRNVRCGKTEDLGDGDTRRVDCYNGHNLKK